MCLFVLTYYVHLQVTTKIDLHSLMLKKQAHLFENAHVSLSCNCCNTCVNTLFIAKHYSIYHLLNTVLQIFYKLAG